VKKLVNFYLVIVYSVCLNAARGVLRLFLLYNKSFNTILNGVAMCRPMFVHWMQQRHSTMLTILF